MHEWKILVKLIKKCEKNENERDVGLAHKQNPWMIALWIPSISATTPNAENKKFIKCAQNYQQNEKPKTKNLRKPLSITWNMVFLFLFIFISEPIERWRNCCFSFLYHLYRQLRLLSLSMGLLFLYRNWKGNGDREKESGRE